MANAKLTTRPQLPIGQIYPTLTLEQALTAHEVHESGAFNVDNTCRRWRRNGATQTYKRTSTRFRFPVKYAMHGYYAITEHSAGAFHTPEECPFNKSKEN